MGIRLPRHQRLRPRDENHGHRKLCRLVSELQGIELEVYNNSKIVAVTLSITNASEEDLVYWQDIPEFTLWSPNIANLDGSLGSGAMLDQAAFWDTNPPLRSFDESSTDPDRGRYIDLKPGESQTLVFPFKINKNNLIDQSAFDELDPSDFCIQTADYDSGTAYRLWL